MPALVTLKKSNLLPPNWVVFLGYEMQVGGG